MHTNNDWVIALFSSIQSDKRGSIFRRISETRVYLVKHIYLMVADVYLYLHQKTGVRFCFLHAARKINFRMDCLCSNISRGAGAGIHE